MGQLPLYPLFLGLLSDRFFRTEPRLDHQAYVWLVVLGSGWHFIEALLAGAAEDSFPGVQIVRRFPWIRDSADRLFGYLAHHSVEELLISFIIIAAKLVFESLKVLFLHARVFNVALEL